MAISTEGATVGIAASGWTASILAILTETDMLFQHTPVVGFAGMGVIGGFAGWCLMIETGKLEGSNRVYVVTLLRRIALGACIGVGGGIVWAAIGNEHKGLWMLGTALIACAPVESFRMVLAKARGLWLQKPRGN
jgi:hypothetical protein